MNYHGKMMNIQIRPIGSRWGQVRREGHAQGHKEARHAAAEIALEADRTIEELIAICEEVLNQPGNCGCGCGLASCSICGPSKLNGRIRALVAKAKGDIK
jgi:hypothetical protein